MISQQADECSGYNKNSFLKHWTDPKYDKKNINSTVMESEWESLMCLLMLKYLISV